MSEKFREDCYESEYTLLGMRHLPSQPELFLLIRENGEDVKLFRFELIGKRMSVDSVTPMYECDPEEDFSGELPDDYPQEALTFNEVLEFVGEILAPQEGEIGEAEIRYAMEKFECSREEAIRTVEFLRDRQQKERDSPDFSSLDMVTLLCRSKGCTFSLHSEPKGEWRFEVHTPKPGQRLVTEPGVFSLVCMDAILHLQDVRP